jgi:hypothetical protein
MLSQFGAQSEIDGRTLYIAGKSLIDDRRHQGLRPRSNHRCAREIVGVNRNSGGGRS